MKRMYMIAATLLLSLPALSGTPTSPASAPNDSIECKRNISFFKTYAKSENYVDAYEFWKKAYTICPGESKDIYIVGAQILNWQVANAKTAEEKEKYFDELMKMYDNRIKYFGNDPSTGVDFILASKASDYLSYKQAKADFPLIYSWLKDVVAEKQAATDPLALSLYLYSSMARMIGDPKHKEVYISDYMTVSGYFDERIKAAQACGDAETEALYAQYKSGADTNFGASGAASCEMVEEIFGPKLDEQKDNKDYLQTIISLLVRLRCNDNPVYFKASEYMFNIEPTSGAAIGIARQALSKKQYDRASKFYEEAIKLSTDNEEKSEAYYAMASMAYEQRAYSRARSLCLESMKANPKFGKPMILIASMYAATASSIYPGDPILQRIVYCLVVDKCERAKAMDPSVTDEANQLIGTYRRYYPSKEDVFMHPDISEGQAFTVGGWIGETTTIRVN